MRLFWLSVALSDWAVANGLLTDANVIPCAGTSRSGATSGTSGPSWSPPRCGRRRQVSRGGFRTRKEAETAFAAYRDQIRSGTYVERDTSTLATYLVDEWLPAIRASVRPTTHDHYARIVTAHVVPRIGGVRLQALTPAQLNAFYADLLLGGRRLKPGAPLAPKTVRHVHTALHKALNDAVRWGRVTRNVADLAEPPRPSTAEMKVYDTEQLRVFLDAVKDDRLYTAWFLMVTTGMRRGEVLGLRWSDVNLDAGRVSVVRTHHGRPEPRCRCRSRRRRRAAARSRSIRPRWRSCASRRRKQREDHLAPSGRGRGTTSSCVFTQEDGTRIHPTRFSQLVRRARAARRAAPRSGCTISATATPPPR